MTLLEKIKLNHIQVAGLVFLMISIVSSGILPWSAAMWDTEFEESYRGYDIYYIPFHEVYGIDTTGGTADTWIYNSGISGARNKIDSWVDEPEYIETHRDFDILLLSGVGHYYGESATITTSRWDSVSKLKSYIDDRYYPTLVYTIHAEDDWFIYRQGLQELNDLRYWGELEGYKTPEFKDLTDAKKFIRARIEELSPAADPTEIASEDPATPVLEDSISGNPKPENTRDTVGALVLQRRTMISAVLGTTGIGCLIYGTGRREEE